MRNILIFSGIILSCSNYHTLVEARKFANQGDMAKSAKLYIKYIESLPENDSLRVYYTLELCDTYIKHNRFEEALICLRELKHRKDDSALIAPRIKTLSELVCQRQGYEPTLNILSEFLELDPEYMEGITDEVLKRCLQKR